MMLSGPETDRAVSRLLLYFSYPCGCPVAEVSEQACGLGAVSYTHLDVYKRQALCIVVSSSIAKLPAANGGTM